MPGYSHAAGYYSDGQALERGITSMPFDIQLQIFQSLSELPIIIQIVKAATCGTHYKALDRKMGITLPMKNCHGERLQTWHMTFSCRYYSCCLSLP